MPAIAGIHHVTAIASEPQRNLDFYTGILGLRLVKLTVNFDDPGSYHFYFGDHPGRPGTILTFFPWPLAKRGRQGAGFTHATAFRVAPGSIDAWLKRLGDARVELGVSTTRFGQRVLPFRDPDAMPLELIEDPGVPTGAGPDLIHGFHSVTLNSSDPAATSRLLTESLGFRRTGSDDQRTRFAAAESETPGSPGQYVDVLNTREGAGKLGAGVVHHVAFRARSDQEQSQWSRILSDAGEHVTPVQDRSYFRSIYFREPGHTLFEIATDQPGFATDETVETLGSALRLPPPYEPRRAEIQRALPPIRLPGVRS
jgi:glyoxalase family protein